MHREGPGMMGEHTVRMSLAVAFFGDFTFRL